MKQHHKHRPLVIAHRGGAQLNLENTLAAFEYAFELGVDGIEIDVQLTLDQHPVVYHDATLNPAFTCDAEENWVSEGIEVNTLELEQFKRFKVGRLNPESTYAEMYPGVQSCPLEPILTLEEVMELLPQNQHLLIDMKLSVNENCNQILARKLVESIDKYRLEKQAILMSFQWDVLDFIAQIAPHISLCYLSYNLEPYGTDQETFHKTTAALHKRKGALWGPNYESLLDLSTQLEKTRLKIFTWTVNDLPSMKNVMALNVKSITTDRPDLLMDLLHT